MTSGEVLEPVRVHDDGRGVRFYVSERGGVRLLGSVYGGRIRSWGEKRRLVAGGPRVTLPAEIDGGLPSTILSFEPLRGCQCGHPIKKFRPPIAWEEVPA
jgi:hypothetical protein